MDTAGVGGRARFERVRHLPDARHFRVAPDTGTDPGFRQPYLLLGPGLPDRDAAKAAWSLNS
jgi:hypothetical protein